MKLILREMVKHATTVMSYFTVLSALQTTQCQMVWQMKLNGSGTKQS
jgi:hypothetical protein